MEGWLLYAFIGITIWSVAAIGDRFFLLHHVKSHRFYVVVPALLQFIVTLPFVIPYGIPHASQSAMLAAVGNGLLEVVVLYYLYVAVSSDEISRVFSLTSVGPILTLIFGWLFLHEVLGLRDLEAFFLFLGGGFLLAAKFGEKEVRLSKAIKPLLIGSLMTTTFTLLLRYAFVESNFWAGFFYSRLGFFVGGLVVWMIFHKEIAKEWGRLSTGVRVGIIGNQLISVGGHAFYFLAISLASAALVQSVLGSQSAVILVFAVIVSFWDKKLLEESVHWRDLAQKGIGVALVIAASYLLAS